MKEERIISALIGLVGACNNNLKTEDTDHVVIKALAFPILYKELDEQSISKMVNEIYSEKNVVAPGCVNCTAPCGNTSDYDMSRFYKAEEEIQKIKLKILLKCQNIAIYLYDNEQSKEKLQIDYEIFYKALSYFSFDIEKELLLELLEELESIYFSHT